MIKVAYDTTAKKRPVNLTLNEDLVNQARNVTENLSSVVESLLAEYVTRERNQRLARSQALDATTSLWNDFNANEGSIADEHSTL